MQKSNFITKNNRKIAVSTTFITGFTALTYEVIWHAYLKNFLGSQAYAAAIIIAVFLAGLSCGYFLFGKITINRSQQKLVFLSGLLEIGIGIWAILFPTLYKLFWNLFLGRSFVAMNTGGDVIICIILIGLPTVMMGGTIPLLTQGLAKDSSDASSLHPTIYGLNTLGGGVGALISGFFLIISFSLTTIIVAAGMINVIAGIVLLICSTKSKNNYLISEKNNFNRLDWKVVIPIAIASFVSGIYSITFQTILMRLVGLSLGSSEYSFCIILTIFIVSLALGVFLFAQFDRFRLALWINQTLIIFGFILIYISIPYWPYLAHLIRISFSSTTLSFYLYYLVILFVLGIFLVIPIGAIGSTLPILFHEIIKRGALIGQAAGYVYGINTLGCILGAICGGYLALFLLNLDQLFIFMICITIIPQIIFVFLFSGYQRRIAVFTIAIACIFLTKIETWPKEYFAHGTFRLRSAIKGTLIGADAFYAAFDNSQGLLAYKDDPNSTIAVTAESDGSRALLVNGKSDGSTRGGDRTTTQLLAHLPALLQNSSNSDVAVIGFGTGLTVGSLAQYQSINSIDIMEISSSVRDFAAFFDEENNNASKNNKISWLMGDAYRYLISSNKKYAIIISEPSNPWVTGVERLYSYETYLAARNRLAPGGIYAQWFHTYSISPNTLKLVLNTFSKAFPESRIFEVGSDLILIGSELPIGLSHLRHIKERVDSSGIKEDLSSLRAEKPEDILAYEVLLPQSQYIEAPLQTLDNPKLSYYAGKDFFTGAQSSITRMQEDEKTRIWIENNWNNLLLVKLVETTPVKMPWSYYVQLFCGLNKASFFKGWKNSGFQCRLSLQKASEAGEIEKEQAL